MLRPNLFSKVLSIVVIDLAQAPICFNQVVLSATQVDLTVLLAVLQLFHPEPSSLEAAAVSQIIADYGCPGSSVVDSAHSFVAL